MSRKNISWFLLPAVLMTAAVIWLSTPLSVQADGIVIPDPPPDTTPVPLEESWLEIRYHRVNVRIEDQLAVTRVEQEFFNPYHREVEGTYIFPLPQGAAVSGFQLWVDGRAVKAEILSAEEARQIYEQIVHSRRDPALLEYIGREAVRVRIFPIPPGGATKMVLEYSQVLWQENGLIQYSYPLNTEKFSARPLQDCSIRVEVQSSFPIRSIYSPSHQDRLVVRREGDHSALIGYQESLVRPDEDFDLIYTVSREDVGIHLLPYRPDPEQPGYFLLLAAPSIEVDHVLPRDIFLVLDTSGSMEGVKLSQAKEALSYVLSQLNPEDRFNVISFSTGVRLFAPELQPADRADEAAAWVAEMEALGGTDINLALLEALSQQQTGSRRPRVVLFLTDGLPTEGVTDISQILANVRSSSTADVRLFPFGVGDDVNTLLLDTLAEDNRGRTTYVRSEEEIQERVSGYYARISTPVLRDLRLEFEGMLVEELYPADLPDLFAGSGLLLTGRFRNLESEDGKVTVTLYGRAEGEMRAYTKTVSLLDGGQAPAVQQAVPRLWAARKIGHLLTQIRLQGENPEWIQAVIDLSIQYGVMTPYTSFLIQEEDILTAESRENAAEKWLNAEEAPPVVGSEAVSQAEAEGVLREAEAVPDLGRVWLDGEEREQRSILRQAGMKTFLLQGEFWVDTAYVPERMTPREILFGSAEYFRMLDDHPHWGIYYALGSQVIFVDGEEAYRIKEDGEVDEISAQGQSPRPVSLPPQDDDALLLTACGVFLLTGGVLWKTVCGQLKGDRG